MFGYTLKHAKWTAQKQKCYTCTALETNIFTIPLYYEFICIVAFYFYCVYLDMNLQESLNICTTQNLSVNVKNKYITTDIGLYIPIPTNEIMYSSTASLVGTPASCTEGQHQKHNMLVDSEGIV